jgi:hypothetical protein
MHLTEEHAVRPDRFFEPDPDVAYTMETAERLAQVPRRSTVSSAVTCQYSPASRWMFLLMRPNSRKNGIVAFRPPQKNKLGFDHE